MTGTEELLQKIGQWEQDLKTASNNDELARADIDSVVTILSTVRREMRETLF